MYFLIINLGLKSIRALVYNEAGDKITGEFLPINTIIKGDYVEQNPSEWWEKAVQVVRKSCLDEEVHRGVRYVTVTSSAGCLVCLDQNGEAVYNSLMVSDRRAKDESDEISKLDEYREIKKIYGCEIGPYYMLPKLLWLKRHEKSCFDKIKEVTTPNGFLINKLVGKNIIDVFDAEKFYYNPSTGYPIGLIDKLSLSHLTFPAVKKFGTNLGMISKPASQALGLSEKVNVIMSSYDAICAFYGSGVTEDGDCCDVSGTVTSLRALADNVDEKKKRRGIFIQSINNQHIVGGSNNLGGGIIEWLKQAFYSKEEFPYEAMEKDAKDSPLGAAGLIFLPYLMGERTPLWNNDARGVFFGIERTHTRRDFSRAVFEGIGFSVKSIFDIIEGSGVDVKKIRVSGGLAQIPTINRIKADILDRQVLVLEELESTSLGALMMMTTAVNIYRNMKQASQSIVKIREIIYPNKNNYRKYKKIYSLYKKVYNSLLEAYEERNRIYSSVYKKLAGKISNL